MPTIAPDDFKEIMRHWVAGVTIVTSRLGDDIHGWLVYPPGYDPTKTYPLVQLMHGGPHTMNRDSWSYRWNTHVFAAPGYDPRRPWLWEPPGGESFEHVKARVGPILDRLAITHPTRDVVVVSHGGVMMALWAHVTGVWDNAHVPPNCGIILIEHHSKGYMAPQVIGDGARDKFTGG